MEAHDESQLVLQWQDQQATLGGAGVLLLGSHDESDLPVRRRFTSKEHAHIERRKQDFVLVDESTNGTFVQTEDERITFVHRREMRLWGSGWISLGEPLTADAAIRFQNI